METRVTRGQRPPSMIALTRLVFSLFTFNDGDIAEDFSEMNPMSESTARKSCRNEVISRIVDAEMKFCGSTLVPEAGGMLYGHASSMNRRWALWVLPSSLKDLHLL